MPTQMILASRLTDGRVVFMTEGQAWSASIDDGIVVDTVEQGAALLEDAQRAVAECVVVDPYLIDVTIDNSKRRPVQMREAIRAFGPSIAGEWVAEEN